MGHREGRINWEAKRKAWCKMRSARRHPKEQASAWKDQVREDCRRRAREQRDVWLGRLRDARDKSLEKAIISSEIRGIVDAVLAAGPPAPMSMNIEDELFAEDLAAPLARNDAEYEQQINEFEEMLLTEVIGYSNLKAEIDKETLLDINDMERMSMPEEASGSGVLCPVCHKAVLQIHNHRISCPIDGFDIDLSMEGLGIEGFRQRLADAYRGHSGNCGGSLKFRVEEQFGAPNMCASCNECDFLQVIVGECSRSGAESVYYPGAIDEDIMTDCDLFPLTTSAIFEIMEQLYSPYPDSLLKCLSKQQMESESGEAKTSLVYGELTFSALCSVLKEALRYAPPDRGLVFYDLGSGAGKQVVSAALVEPRIIAARGIEIVPGMDEIAKSVLSRLKTEFLMAYDFPEKEFDFVCGDMFGMDWSDGDVVLLNSTCFSKRMMAKVQEIILGDLQPGSVLITLTKKFTHPRLIERVCLERRMTWGRAHVYIYQLC